MKKRKRKKMAKIRNMALAHGAIKTTVVGTKKGKRGYTRKNKNWKKDCE